MREHLLYMYDTNQYNSWAEALRDGAIHLTNRTVNLSDLSHALDIQEGIKTAMVCIGYDINTIHLGVFVTDRFITIEELFNV